MTKASDTKAAEYGLTEEELQSLIKDTDDDESGETAETELNNFLKDLGSSASDHTIHIYQKRRGRRDAFLYDTSPAENDLSQIMNRLKDEYGGGDYMIYVRNAKGQVQTKKVISIASPLEKKDRTDEIKEMLKAQGGGGGLSDIMAMMQAQNQQTMQMIQAMNQQNTQLFSAIIQAQPKESGFKMADLIPMLPILKDVLAPKDNSTTMLLKGMELMKDLNGGETNFADVMKTGLSQLASVASMPLPKMNPAAPAQTTAAPATLQAQPNAPEPAPIAPPANAPAPDVSADGIQISEDNPLVPNMALLQAPLQSMLMAASQDKDPTPHAELILQFLGDDNAGVFMAHDKCLLWIVEVMPDFRHYIDWLQELRLVILDTLGIEIQSNEDNDLTGETEKDNNPDHVRDDSTTDGRGGDITGQDDDDDGDDDDIARLDAGESGNASNPAIDGEVSETGKD